MNMTNTILSLYADGEPHFNAEMYDYVDFGTLDKTKEETKRRHKIARGIQQNLKNQGRLENLCRGYWILSA